MHKNTTELPYKLTNDYLFRAVFQSRPKALEGLCRAVLCLSDADSITVTLQNPIELGKTIDSKEFILDLAVLINDSRFLNLEMQVYYDIVWKERSISYACRSFDNLNHGIGYSKALPVVHVGFLDYTLFPEHPEFFATYQLAHVAQTENPYIYSDKLSISVVNLTRIDLATEKDKVYDIDLWARVFKATTWEEINMLAKNNEYLQEVVSGVRQLTEEEQIRQQCQAREDFIYWERIRKAKYDSEIQERAAIINEQGETINQQVETINQQVETINQQVETINQQVETINQQTETINQQTETINQQTETISQQTETISQQTETISQQATNISDKEQEIAQLRALLEKNGISY